MCIRDRDHIRIDVRLVEEDVLGHEELELFERMLRVVQVWLCLLYTSDAADERSSVDLGGRRILKKKKRVNTTWPATHHDSTQYIRVDNSHTEQRRDEEYEHRE